MDRVNPAFPQLHANEKKETSKMSLLLKSHLFSAKNNYILQKKNIHSNSQIVDCVQLNMKHANVVVMENLTAEGLASH